MSLGLQHARFAFDRDRRLHQKATKILMKRREHIMLKKSMITFASCFSHQQCRSRLIQPVRNHADRRHRVDFEPREEDDCEQNRMQDEVQNFRETDQGGNGNSGNNGDGGKGYSEEDQPESNETDIAGIEWWWWWKWKQTRVKTQTGTNGSHLWPVDTAIQVVANEVKETIEPAVRAIVVDPLKQHTKHGLVLVLVVGAFAFACIQIVAALTVVSMGVSLGLVAALGSALLWWSWKHPASRSSLGPSPPNTGNGNNNGYSETIS